MERPLEIHVEHEIPIFFLHAQKETVSRDPCVVHQYVNAPKFPRDLIHHGFDVSPVCHIRLDREGSPPLGCHRGHRLLRSPRIEINHGNVRAVRCEAFGNGPPDALCCARHNRHFYLQSHDPFSK